MRNYNIPVARMFIMKTLAHYANAVSARVAVIKRKYILYDVEEMARERGEWGNPFKKQYHGKLNPNACVGVRACVHYVIAHTHYIRYIKKIKIMSAFAFTLHIEKSTEICIIKEQMTRTGHGWMKGQHTQTQTHTKKLTHAHAHCLANKMPQRQK